MAKTHQQVVGTSITVDEQTQEWTQNGRQSTIIKVEEHARQLSYVEQNVEMMQAIVERIEANMIQLSQNMCSQNLWQLEQRRTQLTRGEEQRSSYVNGETRRQSEHSS